MQLLGEVLLLVCAVRCFTNRDLEASCTVHQGLADCASSRLHYLPLHLPPTIVALDASNNRLTHLQWQLPYFHLLSLNLSTNSIQYVNYQTFIHLFSLHSLDLSFNNIKYLSHLDSNKTFFNTPQLTRLDLRGNPIRSLGKDPIRCDSLKILDLAGCDVRELEGESSLLMMPILRKLVLDRNPLCKMDILVSESLEELYIDETELRYVKPQFYMGLPRLKILHMSKNYYLTSLSSIGMARSPALRILKAEFCSLKYLEIQGLPGLEELYLRGNRIERISRRDFSANGRLSVMDLSMNWIHTMDPSAFSGTIHLTTMDLSGNKLFELGSLSSLSSLTHLNLSENPLFSIDGIEQAIHITVLDLSRCELSSLPLDFFKFGRFESVNLSKNAIWSLPADMSSFTLIDLDLGDNKLSTIEEAWFKHFPRLKRLRLEGNQFTEPFHLDVLKRLEHVELLLNENPWVCNCWEDRYKDFHDHLFTKSNRHGPLICHSPANVTGLTWKTACFHAEVEATVKKTKKNAWLPMLLAAVTILGIIFLLYLLRRRSRGDRRSAEVPIVTSDVAQRIPLRTPPVESSLPTYEEALLMPKPVIVSKTNADTQTHTSFLGSVRSLDSRTRRSAVRTSSSNSL